MKSTILSVKWIYQFKLISGSFREYFKFTLKKSPQALNNEPQKTKNYLFWDGELNGLQRNQKAELIREIYIYIYKYFELNWSNQSKSKSKF